MRCCVGGSSAATLVRRSGWNLAVEWDEREPLGALVESLAPARVRVAYPGVWLREDVYATHGHYGDRHNTVPILERLGAGVTVRVAGEPEGGPAHAEDYEAALAPMYAWADSVAQSGGLHVGGGGSFQIAAWQALNGGGGRQRLRSRAMALGLAAAVAGLNRAGVGPLRADVSGVALRRGALAGFAEVVDRLGVPPAAHVIFGHTHRAGPLPGDDRSEWGRLLNIGSWVYEERFVGDDPAGSPYRPGFAAIVPDDDPAGAGQPVETGREADGVAGHAGANLERELPGRAVVVRDQLVGAGVVDLDRAAVDARPIRSPRAPPTRRRPCTAPSTAPRRRRSGAPAARRPPPRAGTGPAPADSSRDELLDRQLGLVVAALAVVVVEQHPAVVEQVPRRPAEVAVQVPHLEIGVDRHRVGDREARHRIADGVRVAATAGTRPRARRPRSGPA